MEINLKVRVQKEIRYFDSSSFGIYGLVPLTNKDQVNVDEKWGNFTVTGSMPQLIEGNEYDITIKETSHPKYGDGYAVTHVKFDKPTTPKEQQQYIRIMLKEKQAEAIIAKYPNHKILDMMKDGTFDYSDIKGIADKTYNKIKNFLLKNMDIQEAIVELKDLKITFASMKKLIEYYGSPELVVKKVNDNIYSLCRVKSFGFLKVDEYALNRGDDKTSKNRIIAAIEYQLHMEESAGHSWAYIPSLIDKLKELLQIDKESISNVIKQIQSSKSKDFYTDEERIALFKNYFYEKEIKRLLLKLLNHKNELIIEDVDKKIAEIEESNGFTYTEEQRNAIRLAIDNNVIVLNGKAGTGKSFTVQGILNTLDQWQHVCCALSGKAAKILSAKDLNAMTIHRMLGIDSEGKFSHNEQKKLHNHIFVLDEASMCSSYIMYSVISAIPNGAKLIIVGDSAQLPPIGCAAVFDDLLNSEVIPKQELTIVQRQAQKSGILSCANEIREGKQIIHKNNFSKQVFGELKDFVAFPLEDKENIKELTLQLCERFKDKDINDFQVITALKERGDISVKQLNIEIQKLFNDMSKPFVKRKNYEYRILDKVIQNGNNYDCGESGGVSVFNGTLGVITHIEFAKNDKEKDKVYIQFEGIDEIIYYTNDELDQIELAYAITCHRSQGSTIPYVLFLFDFSAYTLLSRQMVYTGITRASKGCVMVCENRALQFAIKTDQSGKRQTFLREMLLENREE